MLFLRTTVRCETFRAQDLPVLLGPLGLSPGLRSWGSDPARGPGSLVRKELTVN